MRTQPKLQMSAALPCPSPFALVMTSGAMYAGDRKYSYTPGIMQNHVTNTTFWGIKGADLHQI